MVPFILLSVLFSLTLGDELTVNEYLQPVDLVCGVTCPAISVAECADNVDYEESEEHSEPAVNIDCFAPKIVYEPIYSCWRATIKCESNGAPVELRTLVEGETFIHATSKSDLEMQVVCDENKHYISFLGRPLNNIFCHIPKNDTQTTSDEDFE
ncbi:hypothetical protein Q1695_001393 [Nippostrongylus brasiliensis]|nr:hypothetical protein Q1695_001393 [Nippostrongylus brasiliensis]